MNLSMILDLVISFSLIYLILSLVASEIQELITTVWQWRSRHLKYSISKLFDEENNGLELTKAVWESPLIRGLYQTGKVKLNQFEGPSYIDAKTFSQALLYSIFNPKDSSWESLNPEITFPEDIDCAIKVINDSPLIKSQELKNNLVYLAKIAKFKVEQGQNQIRQLQQEIENWFDTSMARAAGAYKRNAKAVALIIAFTIAMLVNADTVYIVNSLSKDSTLRMTINQVAQQVIQSNSQVISCLEGAEDDLGKNNCLNSVKSQITSTFNNLSPLPIGWDLSNPLNKQFNPLTLKSIFKTIVGWGISAVAISMGAPFWFEFLNKFVNIRNTGKKPETN